MGHHCRHPRHTITVAGQANEQTISCVVLVLPRSGRSTYWATEHNATEIQPISIISPSSSFHPRLRWTCYSWASPLVFKLRKGWPDTSRATPCFDVFHPILFPRWLLKSSQLDCDIPKLRDIKETLTGLGCSQALHIRTDTPQLKIIVRQVVHGKESCRIYSSCQNIWWPKSPICKVWKDQETAFQRSAHTVPSTFKYLNVQDLPYTAPPQRLIGTDGSAKSLSS